MAHQISTETCVACGACVTECPEEAIFQKDPVYAIDPEKCIACGNCEAACPSGAISAGEA
jgi:NAD-dependent dihydropyrimidine dehydrogenase PreA subunit